LEKLISVWCFLLSLVSLVECRERRVDSIKRAIRDALELIEYSFPRVRRVIIKPNMCYYWDYSTGQTTDPNFVAALIEILREYVSPDVGISIVESDASAMKCKYTFKYLGYEKLARSYGVDLVNLSKVETEKVEVKAGKETFEFMVPKIVKNADLRVNAPKMKYMSFTKVSCALKNIYGCNPYPKKYRYHSRLDETIVALNKVMPFDLHILDGLTVYGSQALKLGLVMGSKDSVAMDVAASMVMKVNPRKVKHIVLAEKEGIGRSSFRVKGASLSYFKQRYPEKKLSDKVVTLGYRIVCALGLSKRLVII